MKLIASVLAASIATANSNKVNTHPYVITGKNDKHNRKKNSKCTDTKVHASFYQLFVTPQTLIYFENTACDTKSNK